MNIKRTGIYNRKGGVVTVAIGAVLLVLTGVGVYEHYSNTAVEREALERTREAANDPRLRQNTPVAERVYGRLDAQEREFRLGAGERTMDIIGSAVGGRTGDLIQFVNMSDEVIRDYIERLYGRNPTAVELEKLEARARAMQGLVKEPLAPRDLQDNSRLIIEMLKHYDEVAVFLNREENRDYVRSQHPELSNLSDDEPLVKYLQPRLESEVEIAGRGYRDAERLLRDAGIEVTPQLVNDLVAQAIREDKSGRMGFSDALEASIKRATALAQLDGVYKGSISGSAQGNCTVEILGTSVSISLSGRGSNKHGAFRANVSGVGRINRETGGFNGALSGNVSNQHGSFPVSGNFSGSASHGSASGRWSAASQEVPASGTFTAGR